MKAVIYESNTGSAKAYAEMLGEKLEIPAYSVKEAAGKVQNGEEIVFVGWVFANKIQGLKKALKRWKPICVCAVGMNADSETYRNILKEANAAAAPMFYLRGKLDLTKIKWLQRKLLDTIRTDLEKQNKSGSEEMISILKNGCDFISEEMLSEALAYLEQHRTKTV